MSIGDLFIAVIPTGILTMLAFMGASMFIAARQGYGLKTVRARAKERLAAVWEAKWALMVPVIVLGGIYTGITTPTEAGVVAVVYALLAETFITKTMTWKKFQEILFSTVKTTGMMFFVITAAGALGIILVYFNADVVVADLLSGITTNKHILMFLVVTLLIILGTFMESVAIVLIMTPILLPIMVQVGMDPIQFGILMGYGVVLGNITPPVGMNLYVGCAIGNISFAQLSKAVLPYIVSMVVVYYLIVYVPWLSLCLVR